MTFWMILIVAYIIICIRTLLIPHLRNAIFMVGGKYEPFVHLVSGVLIDSIMLSRYMDVLRSFGLLFILLVIANILYVSVIIVGITIRMKKHTTEPQEGHL